MYKYVLSFPFFAILTLLMVLEYKAAKIFNKIFTTITSFLRLIAE
jgi:hypothetical protein